MVLCSRVPISWGGPVSFPAAKDIKCSDPGHALANPMENGLGQRRIARVWSGSYLDVVIGLCCLSIHTKADHLTSCLFTPIIQCMVLTAKKKTKFRDFVLRVSTQNLWRQIRTPYIDLVFIITNTNSLLTNPYFLQRFPVINLDTNSLWQKPVFTVEILC